MVIVLLEVKVELVFVKILAVLELNKLVSVNVAVKRGLVVVKEFIIVLVKIGVTVLDSSDDDDDDDDDDVTSKVVDGKVKMPKLSVIELVSKLLVVLGMSNIESVLLVVSLVKAEFEIKKLLSLVELIVLVRVKVEKLVIGKVD